MPKTAEDIRREIMGNYGKFLDTVDFTKPTSPKQLMGGLEEAVNATFGIPETPEQIDYSTYLGPELTDGNRYTTQEMLDMTKAEFRRLHKDVGEKLVRKSVTQALGGIAGLIDGSHSNPYMGEIVAVTKGEAIVGKNVGEKGLDALDGYLQTHYGIGLGTSVEPIP